ncbi:MAG TPA: PA0069 family radical SAM protein [Bdellovibrionales bacterium]|nr:PA0069 family radical SAM protein [Bdellovibrionales bacterium]
MSKLPGRGSNTNPEGRFEKLAFEIDGDELDRRENENESIAAKTQFFRDSSRTIVTENNSPDIPFRFSVNPYRGCEHGCAYCYARPTHEYLNLSAGIDFESKIFVKKDAPELLREKLMKPSWQSALIVMSGITDCYQPIERKLELTRGCLKVLGEFKNPVAMITKNRLVTRDIDLLKPLAELGAAHVTLSVTTLDPKLSAVLEPRTSHPQARLQAIEELAKAGIPVGVNLAPMIPGLTDHEIPAILKAAADAGAKTSGFVPLRLPFTVAPLFSAWLETHRTEQKEKVLSRIRDMRGGKLNDPNFESRMRGQGPIAENMRQVFEVYSRKYGFNRDRFDLETKHFSRPGDQLSLL